MIDVEMNERFLFSLDQAEAVEISDYRL